MVRRKHPSGRPRHETPYRRLPITREPRSEPLTPGLRQNIATSAIGFHIDAYNDEADYDADE